MSNIADDIESIVQDARESREKTAQEQAPAAQEVEHTPGMADKIKKAASAIRKNDPGISAQSVVDFVKELQ